MKRISAILLAVLISVNLVGYDNINTTKKNNLSSVSSESMINKKLLFDNNYQNSISKGQGSKEQIMGWIIINYLSPYMQKSLKDYYRGDVIYWLADPTSRVLETYFVEDKSYFIIKLQVEPYIGAHNPIGIDNFTFKVSLPDDKVTLEKYEHVKSFKVPYHVKKQYLELNLQ